MPKKIVWTKDFKIKVIQMIADGITIKQIGLNMGYHPDYLKQQVQKMREEVGVPNTTALVAYAFRKGYIS
jgi:DNA-binding CsgD family transcriptional regulator